MDSLTRKQTTTIWRGTFPVLLVLLFLPYLLCSGVLLYRTVDTISSSQRRMRMLEADHATLQALIPQLATGRTRAEVLPLLQNSKPRHMIQKDTTLRAGWVNFIFDRQGKLLRLEQVPFPER